MGVEGRLGRQTAEGFECQLTLLDDRRPAISSQNAGSHAGNHMMAYESTHYMTLTHYQILTYVTS